MLNSTVARGFLISASHRRRGRRCVVVLIGVTAVDDFTNVVALVLLAALPNETSHSVPPPSSSLSSLSCSPSSLSSSLLSSPSLPSLPSTFGFSKPSKLTAVLSELHSHDINLAGTNRDMT
jgi:hypothetical protein